MSRPRKEIDWGTLDKLCAMMCTLEEIAGFFDCSIDTIENRVKEQYGITFAEYFKLKSGLGKASLRRYQWKAAEGGNVTMQIWLGKQYLGQRDTSEQRHDANQLNDLVAAITKGPVPREPAKK